MRTSTALFTCLALVVLNVPPTGAASRRECRQACQDLIQACMTTCGDFGEAQRFRRACRNTVLKRCTREGLTACGSVATTTTVPQFTTTTWSPASTETRCGPQLICDAAEEICLRREPVGAHVVYSCEPVPMGCESKRKRTCACVGPSLCPGRGNVYLCRDDGSNVITCECLLCQ